MNNEIMSANGGDAIVAAMSKDGFKAMFALFAGRPDSRCKRLNRKIQIDVDSLCHLKEKVVEKLSLHNIDSVVTTVTVVQKGRESLDFGLWDSFVSHDWKTSDKTDGVMMKWDFLIKLDSHNTPQRHTLSVKISKGMTPKDMLRTMLLSGDDADNDGREEMSVCVVRVDFINHSLADELIRVVEKWNESIPICSTLGGVANFVHKYDDEIAHIIHWTIPIFVLALTISMAGSIVYAFDSLSRLAQSIIGGVAMFQIAQGVGRFLASKAYRSINESVEYYPFSLTNGDKNAIDESGKKASKAFLNFIVTTLAALLINLISAVVVVRLGLV